jgi:predicted PurR-regulated permease PerM
MSDIEHNKPVRTAIDISINLLLLFVLIGWSVQILMPFVSLIAWAGIIAISLHTPFIKLQGYLGGSKKLALLVFTVAGLAVTLVPSWLFLESIVGSAQGLIAAFEAGSFHVQPPSESIREWPLVGEKIFSSWTAAAVNFQGWLESNAEWIKPLASGILGKVAGIGLGVLQFVISTLIAAAFLANAEAIATGLRTLFVRLVGERADGVLKLSTSTVVSVTVGVLGISFIQALLGGVGMMVVGVPAAGLLSLVILILAVAQLPPWLVMFPVIAYVYSVESGTVATVFAVWGIIVSFLDMALKPMFLGRGVEAPMLVILLGAIGGMLMSGIIGLFVGAIVLALSYKLFEAWVAMHNEDNGGETVTE